MGLLGHLKDENSLAQKDVMICLGNTAQFSMGGEIVDKSRFRYFTRRIGQFLYYSCQCGGFQGSTSPQHVTSHVETLVLMFNLTDPLLMLPTYVLISMVISIL